MYATADGEIGLLNVGLMSGSNLRTSAAAVRACASSPSGVAYAIAKEAYFDEYAAFFYKDLRSHAIAASLSPSMKYDDPVTSKAK